MSAPLLDVDHVGMTYVVGGLLARRVVRAVDDVSLRLEAGKPEILAVIGESGSGKTTLARMILNLAKPTDGAIRFLGTDVTRIRTQSRAHGLHAAGAADLPEPVRGVQSAEAARPLSVRQRAALRRRARRRDRGRGRQGAASGRAVARRGERPLPARALGRAIAAHRDRARADLVALADRRRRAGLDGRRLAAHVDRQPVQGAARRAEGLDRLHHARSRDRLLHQRPRADHAARPRGRERRRARRCSPIRSIPIRSC